MEASDISGCFLDDFWMLVVSRLWFDVGWRLGSRDIYKRANQCLFGVWAAELAA